MRRERRDWIRKQKGDLSCTGGRKQMKKWKGKESGRVVREWSRKQGV